VDTILGLAVILTVLAVPFGIYFADVAAREPPRWRTTFASIGASWAATPLAFWLLPPGNGNYSPPWWWVPFTFLYVSLAAPPFLLARYIRRPRVRALAITASCVLLVLSGVAIFLYWWLYCLATW
jgi:hypothetical protein